MCSFPQTAAEVTKVYLMDCVCVALPKHVVSPSNQMHSSAEKGGSNPAATLKGALQVSYPTVQTSKVGPSWDLVAIFFEKLLAISSSPYSGDKTWLPDLPGLPILNYRGVTECLRSVV